MAEAGEEKEIKLCPRPCHKLGDFTDIFSFNLITVLERGAALLSMQSWDKGKQLATPILMFFWTRGRAAGCDASGSLIVWGVGQVQNHVFTGQYPGGQVLHLSKYVALARLLPPLALRNTQICLVSVCGNPVGAPGPNLDS